jgi:anti-sigma B factor antagonist
MTPTSRIDVFNVADVSVVRFHDRLLFDDKIVQEVDKQIAAILPEPGVPIHLVLDFHDVALVSSSLLSKLLILQRRIRASRGTLRLCGMSNEVRSVFRISNLDSLFQIDSEKPSVLALS